MKQKDMKKTIIEALVSHDFRKAERIAVEAIRCNKLSAQFWLYLTQALAFQGYGKIANETLERAWLLDPQAVWVEQAKRDAEKYDKGLERSDLDYLLAVGDITVCAALIVKDEERHIANCISSLYNAVDEIIVVDTGSTDGTIALLKTFKKVKIIHFEWCDDFSAARNAAFPYIKSDWVFWVDADEYLFSEDISCIHTAAALFHELSVPVLVRVGIVNAYEDNSVLTSYDAVRLFPVKYGLRFSSKIHEQIIVEDSSMLLNGATASNPVRIRLQHMGYIKSELERKDKINRNIRLLRQMVSEDIKNPLWYLYIGRELLAKGETNEAVEYLKKCICLSQENSNFGRILEAYSLLIKALIALNSFKEAEAICLEVMKIRCDFPDLLYLYGLIKFNMANMQYSIAEELVKKSKQAFETYRDIISPDVSILDWKADLLYGDIALSVGKTYAAKALYQQAYLSCTSIMKERVETKLKYLEQEILKIDLNK